MIQTTGTYKFINHKNLIFTDPIVIVEPIVEKVDPTTMTIHVDTFIEMEGKVAGKYYIDINPIPVQNLNYNESELSQRVQDRLNDFKIQ